jgi:hypothetical protein
MDVRMNTVVKLRPRLIKQRLTLHESSRERLVLIEDPHYVYAAFFSVSGCTLMGMVLSGVLVSGRAIRGALFLTGIGAGFVALALWGMVRSTFALSRGEGTLRIQRRLGWLRVARVYPIAEIKRVLEWSSIRGTLLRIEFVSGRRKNLTLWADYLPLTGQVALLNSFLRSVKSGL